MRRPNRNLFTMVRKEATFEAAMDPDLPPWFRLHLLALALVAPDRRTVLFDRGELLDGLRVRGRGGAMRPMDKNNLRRAIEQAVQRGYLASGSGVGKLVLPERYVRPPGRSALTSPGVLHEDHHAGV